MIPLAIIPISSYDENEKIVCPFCKNKFIIEEVEDEEEDITDRLLTYFIWFLLVIAILTVLFALIIGFPEFIKDFTYFLKPR